MSKKILLISFILAIIVILGLLLLPPLLSKQNCIQPNCPGFVPTSTSSNVVDPDTVLYEVDKGNVCQSGQTTLAPRQIEKVIVKKSDETKFIEDSRKAKKCFWKV